MRYARTKRSGSKSKRRAAPRANAPVARWKACNPAHEWRGAGEFSTRERKTSTGAVQHRGHVCLTDCECAAALGPRPKSEAEIVRAADARRIARQAERHAQTGAVCSRCYTLISVSGAHYC